MTKKFVLPLDEIEVNDGEMLLLRGGNNTSSLSGSGSGCGCNCNCNCNCGSSGKGCGCDCNCSCNPTPEPDMKYSTIEFREAYKNMPLMFIVILSLILIISKDSLKQLS